MSFETKLRRIHDQARVLGSADLRRQTRSLATIVADVLRKGAWDALPARTSKELDVAVVSTRATARLLDAASYVGAKVFAAETALVVDLQLRSSLRAAQDQIIDMFATKAAPRRGFVYVAWSHRPERYWYIGRANSVTRLNLAAHGKLARATAHATKLSLVFPSQSRPEILGGVEGSILALLEHAAGDPPELNERREAVPAHEGTADLSSLGAFLEEIGYRLVRN